ncbi:MAG TPA: carbamate kinase [Actinomycetota bacterium]|nr:carbamate kinase [Actinomycetota bacterium]
MTRPLVIALGGNAISPADELDSIENQFAHTMATASGIVALIPKGWESIVITHGNGPQVGNIVTRVERSRDVAPWLPLDICVADTQGGMGYMIQQCLQNALADKGITKPVATVVTQVLVDPNDPAFLEPSKPIGPERKLVASPRPLRIIEAEAISVLLAAGAIVIAAGGGGVPVVQTSAGLKGVEGVIDKDLTSAVLAESIGAEALVILTDAEGIYRDFSSRSQLIDSIDTTELRGLIPSLAEGSIRPKAEAACAFVENGGSFSVIASLDQLDRALSGDAGTRVTQRQ